MKFVDKIVLKRPTKESQTVKTKGQIPSTKKRPSSRQGKHKLHLPSNWIHGGF